MYLNPTHSSSDAAVAAQIVREQPLASLITTDDAGLPQVSHLPMRLSVDGQGGWTLVLSDGSTLAADIVVVGIGVIPNAELAAAAGLETAPGGIVVDAHGRTGDPHIFAAGEVALHINTRHGRHDRQETWAHAAAHGAHVGRSLVAADAGYAEIASYWTDQYDINLQAWGTPIGQSDIVRGDPASGKFLVFHIVEGLVAGVSAINAVRDLRAAKKLLGHPAPADLTDPAVPLKAPA